VPECPYWLEHAADLVRPGCSVFSRVRRVMMLRRAWTLVILGAAALFCVRTVQARSCFVSFGSVASAGCVQGSYCYCLCCQGANLPAPCQGSLSDSYSTQACVSASDCNGYTSSSTCSTIGSGCTSGPSYSGRGCLGNLLNVFKY